MSAWTSLFTVACASAAACACDMVVWPVCIDVVPSGFNVEEIRYASRSLPAPVGVPLVVLLITVPILPACRYPSTFCAVTPFMKVTTMLGYG